MPLTEQLVPTHRYQYVLAFENKQDQGYVTEKPFQAFSAGAIPLYWGAPDAADILPSGSFVDMLGVVSDEDYDAVFRRLQRDGYEKYLSWRLIADPKTAEDRNPGYFANALRVQEADL